ncbi:MAG: hypothetical protein ACI9WU_004063 [Myxococcota bacterium]|jgi:hypothetical protein
MSERADWVDDLDVQPGDHIIAIITDEDDVKLLARYITAGLQKGEHCSVLASPHKVEPLKAGVCEHGIDADQAIADESMLFVDPRALGTGDDGEFDMDRFIDGVSAFIDQCEERGIKHVRNCGAMSWLNDVASPDDALYLEARLADVFEGRPMSGF